MARTVPLALLLSASLVTGRAQAQNRLMLRWEAPESCPSADSVRDGVARLLGGAVPEGPIVSARAHASTREVGFELTLHTDIGGITGQRVLSAQRCDELADATALILALMIDPDAATALVGSSSDPTAGAARSISGELAPPIVGPPQAHRDVPNARAGAVISLSEEARPRRTLREEARDAAAAQGVESNVVPAARVTTADRLGGFIGVVGGVDVGTVPSPTAGIALEGGVGLPWVEGRLRTTFLFPQSAAASDLAGAGANIFALIVDGRGCLRPFDAFRELGGCLGLSGRTLVGSGYGVSGARVGAAFRGEALAGVVVAWRPVSWFDLELGAELVVPLGEVDFAIRVSSGADLPVYQTPAVAGRFGLGSHLHF